MSDVTETIERIYHVFGFHNEKNILEFAHSCLSEILPDKKVMYFVMTLEPGATPEIAPRQLRISALCEKDDGN